MRMRETSEGRVDQHTGGSGIPIPSWAQKDILEADHPTLSVQTRSRKRLPAWIGDAMKQAETLASGGDKVPAVVLHQDGARYEDALVVMRLKNLAGGQTKMPKLKAGQRGESSSKPVVKILTDGYYPWSSGKGVWAAVIEDGPKLEGMWGTERETTSGQMQLRAAIEALKALEEPRRVRLHPSPYIFYAFECGWVYEWERNGWRMGKDWPVEKALWCELLALTRRHQVKFLKVAGNAGIPANERCDPLVQLAMARAR